MQIIVRKKNMMITKVLYPPLSLMTIYEPQKKQQMICIIGIQMELEIMNIYSPKEMNILFDFLRIKI
ncbi:MAG: hypothetical protein HeimC2_32080 [Candidatus Heimdallarchaeota archaeon LC_2]|nr:MAG: hypothetical protein HeimC2_32080 [Candidatus Heimdallarchaeota archaeon LC_2]